ncbi:diguanylate cyclase [Methylomonas sp. AM2-LC]|uniref:GGDEF domain-containing protein n=1 Tax=Methylomonas sp. AM2-LC TaxID=3153301 RepID=UPI00326596FA
MNSTESILKQQKARSWLALRKKIQLYIGFAALWVTVSYLISVYVLHFSDIVTFFSCLNITLFMILSSLVLYSGLNEVFARHNKQIDKLKQSEETLLSVLNGSQLGFWDWHLTRNEVKRNATWAEMLGFHFKEINETTQQWSDFVHPQDREAACASIEAALKGITSEHQLMYRMKTKSGAYKWILDRARVVERDEYGNAVRMSGTHTDVDALKKTEQALQASEQRFRGIFENAAVGIAQVNSEGSFQLVNTTFCHITGYSHDELMYNIKYFQAITHPDDLGQDIHLFKQLMNGTLKQYELEKRYLCKDGSIAWVNLSVAALLDEQGSISSISSVQDITQQKSLQTELEYRAHIDFLTEIANRRYFIELAERELARTRRYQQSLALIMLDLDFFKRVNDEYGHKAGDKVLQMFSSILRNTFRAVDVIGRLGGEEFAVLLPQTDLDGAVELAQRLQENINCTDMRVERAVCLRITVSMGIAVLTEQDTTIEQLLNKADKRLYQAKTLGRNRIVALV